MVQYKQAQCLPSCWAWRCTSAAATVVPGVARASGTCLCSFAAWQRVMCNVWVLVSTDRTKAQRPHALCWPATSAAPADLRWRGAQPPGALTIASHSAGRRSTSAVTEAAVIFWKKRSCRAWQS